MHIPAILPFPSCIYLPAFAGGALACWLTLPFWRRFCQRFGLVDDPGHRKIHAEPIPLAGGLAVMSGLSLPLLAGFIGLVIAGGLGGWTAVAPGSLAHPTVLQILQYGLGRRAVPLLGIVAGALAILLVGLADDKWELAPGAKFLAQLVVALGVAASGVRMPTLFVPNVLFQYCVTALWILTVVNAFNFMDNMNGLCAGLGLIGAGYFGLFSGLAGHYLVAGTAWLVAGALAGFLPFNYPKASVFLGDSGSHLVGYFLAVLGILPHFYTAKHPRVLAVLTPLVVLAVPLGDLVWVVWLRWRRKAPFYVGDTNHLSHRLVRSGLSPARAVGLIWILGAVVGALGFVLQ